MKERSFGARRVSEIGLGTWQLGSTEWGQVDDERAERVLSAALDSGVSFIDTADIYGGGESERRIGRFLSGMPSDLRPLVATKLGRSAEPGWPSNFTYEVMRRHTEASLQRLQCDSLDLTQLHCIPREVMRGGEVFENLRRLQNEGLVRAFGASVETIDEALDCLEVPGLASLQVIFNVFRQKPASELFDAAKARNVAIIVRLPLASGLLSGRMTKATTFAPTDHRTFNRDGQAFSVGETFSGLPFERGVALAAELQKEFPAPPILAQFALRYCLDFDAVTTVIPGASSALQVRSNAAASECSALGTTAHERLREFYAREVHPHIRGSY